MPIYMKYDGIEGSAKGRYKGWIELESCQLEPPKFGGMKPKSTGRMYESITALEVLITKKRDNSTALLYNESLLGEGKKATIVFVKGSEAPYFTIELENTLISSYTFSGTGGADALPIESLTLDFSKINFNWKAPSDPKAKAAWDLAAKKGA